MLRDLAYLFFPVYCAACDNSLHKNERVICTTCRHKLPLLNFHKVNDKKVEKVFYGRIPLENATSLLIFEKDGLVQNLIHNLKYRGREEVGVELGKWLGGILCQIPEYQKIDYVVPVPIHRKRYQERGYNQVTKFGKEIASSLQARYTEKVLKKKLYHTKQSKFGRIARWKNIAETFGLKNDSILTNKHVLLVDDIVTTGATIEACCDVLLKIPNIKISVATMAITI